ncbi:zonadhesin-like [Salmo trutta]|uniref:zonadhesin-like n=1 Tax=Salmo trutta TaxID=8032 RepID=UPI0011315EC8|nr:zonadhesin-like [Salmo trutta]
MTTAGARPWPTLRLSSSPSAGTTPFKVLLDGQLVSLPLGLNSQLMVFCSGQRAVVKTAVGITLTFDWHSTVHVKLPSPYQGAVCGLCGNYNAMPQDDLQRVPWRREPCAVPGGQFSRPVIIMITKGRCTTR